MFSDYMVLQRERAVPVWGWGTPGASVQVSFAGQNVAAVIDTSGKWQIRLAPLAATADGQSMTISSGGEAINFQQVLVGDVWFASGQSNMHWKVKNSNDAVNEIAAANFSGIRLYQVPNLVSRTPADDVQGEWTLCTPETIPEFSAVAYFFGRELHQAEDVPIGLVHSSWGGTPSEAWTSLEMLESKVIRTSVKGLRMSALRVMTSRRCKSRRHSTWMRSGRSLKRWKPAMTEPMRSCRTTTVIGVQ
ncbi:MAG: hypothetical protein AAGA85_23275 [Bacteroidota bacterium]